MRRTHSLVLLSVVFALLSMSRSASSQQPEKPDPTVGQRIDSALGQIREGANSLAAQLREEFAQARTKVNELGVQARVYARLHWDKALNQSAIDIEMQKGGVVVLRGEVPSASGKRKAVEIARDTVGVERVVDQLAVKGSP